MFWLPSCQPTSESRSGKVVAPGVWMFVDVPGDLPFSDSVAEVALVQIWQPSSSPVLHPFIDTLRITNDRALSALVAEVWIHDSLTLRLTPKALNKEPRLKAWLGPSSSSDTLELRLWVQWAGSTKAFVQWQRKWNASLDKRLRLSRYLLDSASLRGPWTAQTEDALLANQPSGSRIRAQKGDEVEIEYKLLAINQHPVADQPTVVQNLCMGTPDQVLPGFAWALSFLSEGDHAMLHLGVNQTNGLLPGHDLLAPNHKTLTFALHVKKIHPSTCL